MLRVGEHPAALLGESEIEVRFGMILAEENRGSETVGRGGQIALFELGQSKVEV